MAAMQDPTSLDVLETEGYRRGATEAAAVPSQEFEEHVRTYRSFLRGAVLFVAHVAVILLVMAFFLVR